MLKKGDPNGALDAFYSSPGGTNGGGPAELSQSILIRFHGER